MEQGLIEQGLGKKGISEYADDMYRGMLLLSVQSLEEEQVSKAHDYLLNYLSDVAQKGLPQQQVDGFLDTVEMSTKKKLKSMAYDVLPEAISTLLFDGSSESVLNGIDQGSLFDKVRSQITPESIQAWVTERLNSPYLKIKGIPDPDWMLKREQKEAALLVDIQSRFTPKDWENIKREEKVLLSHHEKPLLEESLPMISVQDFPVEVRPSSLFIEHPKSGHAMHVHHQCAQSGVGRLSLHVQTSHWPIEEWSWLEAWSHFAPSMGGAGLNWQSLAQSRLNENLHLKTHYSSIMDAYDTTCLKTEIVIDGYQLDRYAHTMPKGVLNLLNRTEWHDVERLKYLVDRNIQHMSQHLESLAGHTHEEGLSAYGDWEAQTCGPQQLGFYIHLRHLLQIRPNEVIEHFEQLQKKLGQEAKYVLTIGSPAIAKAGEYLQEALVGATFNPQKRNEHAYVRQEPVVRSKAWCLDQQVGYMYQSFKAPVIGHEDFAPMKVLACVLEDAYLFTAIREIGGAYGAFTELSSHHGVLNFSSYRDPRAGETLDEDDFYAGAQWAMEGRFSQEQVDQGILNVLKILDKPMSPMVKAFSDWNFKTRNVTLGMQQKFREAVLGTTRNQLMDVAGRYLSEPLNTTAVISRAKGDEMAERQFPVMDVLSYAGSQPQKSRKSPSLG